MQETYQGLHRKTESCKDILEKNVKQMNDDNLLKYGVRTSIQSK